MRSKQNVQPEQQQLINAFEQEDVDGFRAAVENLLLERTDTDLSRALTMTEGQPKYRDIIEAAILFQKFTAIPIEVWVEHIIPYLGERGLASLRQVCTWFSENLRFLATKVEPRFSVQNFYFNRQETWHLHLDSELWRLNGTNNAPQQVQVTNEADEAVSLWVQTLISDRDSLYCIDEAGRLWAWGGNTCGQLGLGHCKDQVRPQQVCITNEAGEAVPLRLQTLVGRACSVYCIDKANQLWVWGHNIYGRLGLGHRERQFEPQRVCITNEKDEAVPLRVKTLVRSHTAVYCIDKAGQLWAWGNNANGELGLGHCEQQLEPQRVCITNEEDEAVPLRFKTLISDRDSVYCIDEAGELWVWGNNIYGRLGLGHRERQFEPQRVCITNEAGEAVPLRVQTLVSRNRSVYCIDEADRLWVWGENGHGRLALGHREHQLEPQRVCITDEAGEAVPLRVKTLINDFLSICCIDQAGQLWVWGNNHRGQLGLGHCERQFEPQRVCITNEAGEAVPLWVKTFVSRNRSVYCIDQADRLWVWGDNDHGQLGLGHREHQLEPARLDLPGSRRELRIKCAERARNPKTPITEKSCAFYYHARNEKDSDELDRPGPVCAEEATAYQVM